MDYHSMVELHMPCDFEDVIIDDRAPRSSLTHYFPESQTSMLKAEPKKSRERAKLKWQRPFPKELAGRA